MISIMLLQTAPAPAPVGFGLLPLLLLIILCVVIFFIVRHTKRKNEQNNNTKTSTKSHWEENSMSDNKVNIPNICPHCKNPNTKKLLECEWCGNKVC